MARAAGGAPEAGPAVAADLEAAQVVELAEAQVVAVVLAAVRAAAVAVAQAAELLEVVHADLAAGPPEVARVDLVAAECRREEG